ncbi:MAG: hypothetical protein ACQEWV_07705 [Bacillota bacterium]
MTNQRWMSLQFFRFFFTFGMLYLIGLHGFKNQKKLGLFQVSTLVNSPKYDVEAFLRNYKKAAEGSRQPNVF